MDWIHGVNQPEDSWKWRGEVDRFNDLLEDSGIADRHDADVKRMHIWRNRDGVLSGAMEGIKIGWFQH